MNYREANNTAGQGKSTEAQAAALVALLQSVQPHPPAASPSPSHPSLTPNTLCQASCSNSAYCRPQLWPEAWLAWPGGGLQSALLFLLLWPGGQQGPRQHESAHCTPTTCHQCDTDIHTRNSPHCTTCGKTRRETEGMHDTMNL